MLILDLDDTIFETTSINPMVFDPAISIIKTHFKQKSTDTKLKEIITDLWTIPIDIVFQKYRLPPFLVAMFYQELEEINHKDLNIKTFEDYHEIKKLSNRKILVTTGLKGLQLAKVKALKIESDFEQIHVDDPRLNPRKKKVDLFKQILIQTKKAPSDIWVIGDNPDSEIKAGKMLGMNTIQRRSKSKKLTDLADYHIESFEELRRIIT